jgi:hypothetical protein
MITVVNSNSLSEIRNIYLSKMESNTQLGQQVIIHHFGEFTSDLINGLAEAMEDQLISAGASKKLIKRIFSILIEGLQNIRQHGERDESGSQGAYLLISKNKENYFISMGNMIEDTDRELVENYLKKINYMTTDELKGLYSELLNNGFFTRKGGAGLGFLTMRIKSENPLNFHIEQLSHGKCFFSVEITINKNM